MLHNVKNTPLQDYFLFHCYFLVNVIKAVLTFIKRNKGDHFEYNVDII